MEGSHWQSGTRRCRLASWDEFNDALASQIQNLKESGFRYIVISDSARYIQLASLGDGGIHGEASKHDGEGVECLSRSACNGLLQFGWLSATKTRRGKIFQRRWTRSAAADDIAAVAVQTLRDVLKIASPAQLTIRKSEFSDGSAPTIKKSGEWVSPTTRTRLPKNPKLHLPSGSISETRTAGGNTKSRNSSVRVALVRRTGPFRSADRN